MVLLLTLSCSKETGDRPVEGVTKVNTPKEGIEKSRRDCSLTFLIRSNALENRVIFVWKMKSVGKIN